jgi:GT2 family glycosyltransferase
VPTRDRADLLRRCLAGLLESTDYPALEIVVVDNQTTDPTALALLDRLAATPRVRVVQYDFPFSFSAINNYAVTLCGGEILCFLNNDIEVISAEWLREMVRHAARSSIGAVGAKLLYPNDTIQHAGIFLGVHGVAGHPHRYLPVEDPGYAGRAVVGQDVSAVTGACLMLRRRVFEELGGYNDRDLPIAFNDVDLCLRLLKAGYRNYWTPYALLRHHESATRGSENTPEKQERFQKELSYMKRVWGQELLHDRAYSPNLTLSSEDLGFAFPPRVRRPWE